MIGHGKAGRVLVICPRFFDYQTRIARILQQLGHDTVVLDDRPLNQSVYKIALRLAPRITAALTRGAMVRHLSQVKDQHFDHVLVVKGEAVTPKVLSFLRGRFPNARFSLYLWDAVRNNGNSKAAAALYDAVATFDPADARTYGWNYRPLFAAVPPPDEPAPKVYDWSFVGTLHSDRLAVLARLQVALEARPFFLFGYYASPMLAALGKLKRRLAGLASFGTVSTQPLDPATVRDVIRQSKTIADIEHPRQVGLTIRTIETLLAGRKLITTNATVRQSALYDPTRVCVIDRQRPQIPSSFFESAFEPLPAAVRHGYSEECWARQVLGLPDAKEALF